MTVQNLTQTRIENLTTLIQSKLALLQQRITDLELRKETQQVLDHLAPALNKLACCPVMYYLPKVRTGTNKAPCGCNGEEH